MRPNIRKKDDENLTNSAIELVISKLESDTPITKKDACSILNISYNTTRLNNIINNYKDKKDSTAKRRKELRNTPISISDASYIVGEYLAGTSMQEISEATCRSIGIIKRTLVKYNIPIRSASVDYFNPIDLNYEEEEPKDYIKGDLVYSARYDCPAEIHSIIGEGVYRIWLLSDSCRYACQPSYELSDLRKVQKELNIEIKSMPIEEIHRLILEARANAKKGKQDE